MADSSKVTFGSRSFSVSRGASISIVNGRVLINGKEVSVDGDLKEVKEIKIIVCGAGTVGSIDSDSAIEVQNGVSINGNINAGGSIRCGDVNGSANAGGTVHCGNVTGSASAGGTVNCSSAARVSDSRGRRY